MFIPKKITGIRRSEFHFTTVVPFSWVLENHVSGLVLEDAMRDMQEDKSVDPRVAELAPIRSRMQRPFLRDGIEKRSIGGKSVVVPVKTPTSKLVNTKGSLRDYLLQQFAVSPEEAFGVLPGFVSFWPERLLEQEANVSVEGLLSPWATYEFQHAGRGALADGECRHLAGVLINADPKVPSALKDKLLNRPVTVEVYHGIPTDHAAKMFVDLNCEGTKVDTITRANIDPRNKWITATKAIFEELGIKYATTGRQLTTAHRELGQLILLTHAEQMVKSIVIGAYQAFVKNKRGDSWDGVDFERLHYAGVTWFREIFTHFKEGPEVLADKSRVIRTIAVRVALASLGGAFYHDDKAAIEEARRVLREVNWTVSEAWNGIGGKVVVNENNVIAMSAGSGKESITKAVQALTKPETKAGRAIRGRSAD
ncbi:hypothetical protein BBK82_10575 [Lentzea guizhouensis]|uniref:DGQHR domain-containing protein n=1 Tax=Lentzea guizhouensis TaxID=1586287 RepID=A0A1B2HFD6_9PSEU|nr:hypothetical protein [Lentzea guizhouensis]ANZ36441.1 hypothetical protein BBK82_10575 [Lentzea guizhouensis]